MSRRTPRIGAPTCFTTSAVALALICSNCSLSPDDTNESGLATDRAIAELAFSHEHIGVDPSQGMEVFAFEAEDLYSGELVNGFDLYFDAPAIVSFVDPSCPLCLAEGPELARAAENYPDINFVVVHGFGYTETYLDFNDRANLFQDNVVHLVDNEGLLWERFDITVQPAAILVDGQGRISTTVGSLGKNGLAEAVALVEYPNENDEGEEDDQDD